MRAIPPPLPGHSGRLGSSTLQLVSWTEYAPKPSPFSARVLARRFLTPARLAVVALAMLVVLLVATAWPPEPHRQPVTVEPPPAPAAVVAERPAPPAPPAVVPAPPAPAPKASKPLKKLVVSRR
ncbi:MAG: hypothetical protein K1X89_04010 [Myxococcaceae bacterium]|nr:hypothetical protein [Myxococcaceae bacterium]